MKNIFRCTRKNVPQYKIIVIILLRAGAMAHLSKILLIIVFSITVSYGLYNDVSHAQDKNPFNAARIAGSPHESARFLAGKPLPASSGLVQLTADKRYISYVSEMKKSWELLQKKNLNAIEQWRKQHLPKKYNKTILYPFSGPDILNAVAFFPEGNEYIMFGLEPCGEVPNPLSLPRETVFSGLSGLRASLNEILNMNFFKTVDMQKKVSTNEFNSAISIIMWFLGQLDYDVVQAHKIWIDNDGLITAEPSPVKQNKYIPGAEIHYKDAAGATKRIRYFQVNVIDYSLSHYSNFIPHLQSYGRFTSFIKSASYLMHNDSKFERMRQLVLSRSDIILQDDSGIAFKFYSPYQWMFTFFGVYTTPVPLFANRYQPGLKEAFDAHSKGALPFSYGYNNGVGKSNLMLAERIQ